MKVDESGNLLVLADRRLSLDEIKNIVAGKTDWISNRLAKKNAAEACDAETTTRANVDVDANARSEIAEIFCGKKTFLRGEIFCVKPHSENKSYAERDCVFVPEKYFSAKEVRLKALKNFIKKYSEQNVSEEISRFGSYVSLCPSKIEFRNIPNGWLRCASPEEKVITLDYRVCQLPPNLQHYLIVHAFSHFTNAGHDGDFWNTVSNYLPNFQICLKELQKYDFLKEI